MNPNPRPLFYSFLFLFFFFLASSCSNNPQHNETSASIGILWEVSKAGTAPNYVFGTVHSEDERVTRLPEPVSKAFNTSDIFVLEMMLDKATSKAVLKTLYFTDGRKLHALLDDELYQLSVAAMAKKGLPEDLVNRMKPWAVFTILNMPEQKTGVFMDAMLFETAREQGKVIHGLETHQEQTAVFDEMSMSSQIALLKSTLDNMEDMNGLLDEVIDVYLSRDLSKVLALNKKYEALIDKQLAAEFNQRLVIDRNYRMVERMLPMLEEGNCFVAVGALHLPGKTGILTLLKQHGYSVHARY